jgi:CRISPR-associated endonuclease/helicase Cas3
MEVIRELTDSYGTTIVLCTATQPALSQSLSFKSGLVGVREMIPNPIDLYNVFRRANIENLGKLSDVEVAEKIGNYRQALCVVNTRKHARVLYELLQIQEGVHHLSALMCPAHRNQVLNRIREELREELPCRVISTQLIEAGVDIDFPIVFRSAAGIDSLAQAAGRCNREGKIEDGGRVFVFIPEEGLPAGHFRQAAETAEMVLRHHRDPLSISAVEEYF